MNDLPYDPKHPTLRYVLWKRNGVFVQIDEQTPTGWQYRPGGSISSLPDDIRIPLLAAQRLGADPAEFIHTEPA